MSSELEKRKANIIELYRTVLERPFDEPGLNVSLYLKQSLQDIERGMRESPEYLELQRKKGFVKQLEALGTGELLVMGSSPRTAEHVETLLKTGIQAAVNLDHVLSSDCGYKWCENILHEPLYPNKPITKEQIIRIFKFLYNNILVKRNKTLVHSDLGVSRAPMIVALFLVAEKKLSLSTALNMLLSKQKIVNPSKDLVTADLLRFIKETDFHNNSEQVSLGNVQYFEPAVKFNYLKITNNLFVCRDLNDKVAAEMKDLGLKVVIDLNRVRQKLVPGAQWFGHVHLPVEDYVSEMMPVAVRNVKKYTAGGCVIVFCKHLPSLIMFVEGIISEMGLEERQHIDVNSLRSKLPTLQVGEE